MGAESASLQFLLPAQQQSVFNDECHWKMENPNWKVTVEMLLGAYYITGKPH
jgi:hypothetical protein